MTRSAPESKITRPLLTWYTRNKRALPWRETRDPYRIWLSEVMLQQTQVSRVVDYYIRFLKRFPTLNSLAEASWPSVLPMWRGLGYYGRARNLLRTSRYIVSDHEGKFPRSQDALEELPGIGPYTASAILCFAFQECVPTVDTNVNRVIKRVFGCTDRIAQARALALIQSKSEKARELNYALMDLGATICKANHVSCGECPLRGVCEFYRNKRYESLKKVAEKGRLPSGRSQTTVDVALACIHRDGNYLIGRRKQSAGGFWEFPGGKRERGESIRHCLKREVKEELGVEVSVRPHFICVERRERDITWRLHFCRSQILRGHPRKREYRELKWVKPDELRRYSLPSANRAAVRILERI